MSKAKKEVAAPIQLVQIIQLGATPDSINEIEAKYKDVVPVDAATLKTLKEGIAAYRGLRGAITDKHAELKKPILEKGRLIDAEKNKLIALIEPKEKALNDKRESYEKAEEKRLAAEAAAKALAEKQRIDKIQVRITGFSSCLKDLLSKTAAQLQEELEFFRSCITPDTFNYEEFTEDANRVKFTTEQALNKAYMERRALEDREAEIAAQRAAIEAENAALEEKRQAAVREQAKLDATKAELETKEREAAQQATAQAASVEPAGNIIAVLPVGTSTIACDIGAEKKVEPIKGFPAPLPKLVYGHETYMDEAPIVAENMQQYGGSFIQFLGKALSCADMNNKVRIKRAFPEYWNQYLTWGK